ncbi:MAG: twin-arginine translocase TatA/TatE family subunit [bacterium]|nr:twin-arginine translocase TatA/TatE family subunit [bacterium]MDE0501457.1 twin-arginine translocase TatA/TatE family subunit [bacterium]
MKPLELGIIVLILLLLFGASKLPKLARSLGSSAREFRKGVEEGKAEEAAAMDADAAADAAEDS